jgi:hypothetical protein
MRDTDHQALTTALDEGHDWFDVVMVGFNLLNPSARGRLLAATQTRDIGVLLMCAAPCRIPTSLRLEATIAPAAPRCRVRAWCGSAGP